MHSLSRVVFAPKKGNRGTAEPKAMCNKDLTPLRRLKPTVTCSVFFGTPPISPQARETRQSEQ